MTKPRAYVESAPSVTSTATDRGLRPLRADGTLAPGYEYWDKGWHGRDLDYYDKSPDWTDRWIAGGPERVIAQINALRDSGIRDICCIFGVDAAAPPRHELERRMRRFAREILPHFHG